MNNNHQINKDKTLIEALEQINSLNTGPLVLFVVDKENRMVGTLTDGDSRRALIAGASVNGTISLDANFNGCPHCGSKRFYICDNCKTVVCWHGQERVTCPHCHQTGTIYAAGSVDLRGGGF